mgnify:CR=1 FL=1|jgi:hypothetical protein
MAHLRSLRGGAGPHGPQRGRPHRGEPHLPAFCRTRRPTTVVSVTSLRAIHRLLLLVLVFQLSTLLLVIAGPVPPQLPREQATRRASLPEVPGVQEPRDASRALLLRAP